MRTEFSDNQAKYKREAESMQHIGETTSGAYAYPE